MIQQKRNITHWLVIGTFVLLIELCFMMSIGTAYGRYNVTQNDSLHFKVRQASKVYLLSERTTDGTGQNADMNWYNNDSGKSLTLCVSNSDENGNSTPTGDITVRIRVFVPEVLDDGTVQDSDGSLKLSLRNESDGVVYKSEAAYLDPNTPMYKSNGQNGWVYSFISADESSDESSKESSKERVFVLPGGSVSDITVTLILEDETVLTESIVLYVDRV